MPRLEAAVMRAAIFRANDRTDFSVNWHLVADDVAADRPAVLRIVKRWREGISAIPDAGPVPLIRVKPCQDNATQSRLRAGLGGSKCRAYDFAFDIISVAWLAYGGRGSRVAPDHSGKALRVGQSGAAPPLRVAHGHPKDNYKSKETTLEASPRVPVFTLHSKEESAPTSQVQPALLAGVVPAKTPKEPSQIAPALDLFCELYQWHHGRDYVISHGKDDKLLADLIKRHGLENIMAAIRKLFADSWWRPKAAIGILQSQINLWLPKPGGRYVDDGDSETWLQQLREQQARQERVA